MGASNLLSLVSFEGDVIFDGDWLWGLPVVRGCSGVREEGNLSTKENRARIGGRTRLLTRGIVRVQPKQKARGLWANQSE